MKNAAANMPQNDVISESEEEEILHDDVDPPPPSIPIPGTSKPARLRPDSAVCKRAKLDSGNRSKRSITTSNSMKALWAKRRANKPQ